MNEDFDADEGEKRVIVATYEEIIDLNSLSAYAMRMTDRRQQQLDRYVDHCKRRGTKLKGGSGLVKVTVNYYRKDGYPGRLYAYGFAA